MKLGFYMGYAQPGTTPLELIELAQEAERLGYDSAWAAEAWGTDAVSVLAWLAAMTTDIKIGSAILQMPARTPANTAMTAATLDLLSGGRFLLGLGTSGPQVVEGWHGEPWGKPLPKTREYVEIVRAVLRRDVLEHHGEHYDIPYSDDDATGLGKPLKLMMRPLRAEIPIYLASLQPRSVALASEIADGWIPLFFSPERAREMFPAPFARAGLEIAPAVPALLSDDLASARDALKPYYGLYIGGMGSRGKNFYNDLRAATATRPTRSGSRSCTSTARSARPLPRFPTRSSTRWRSSGRRSGSRNGSTRPRGVRRDDHARVDAPPRDAAGGRRARAVTAPDWLAAVGRVDRASCSRAVPRRRPGPSTSTGRNCWSAAPPAASSTRARSRSSTSSTCWRQRTTQA